MMAPGVGIVDHRYRFRFRERFPFVYGPFPLV